MPDLDPARPRALDAETLAYLGALGLDFSEGGVPTTRTGQNPSWPTPPPNSALAPPPEHRFLAGVLKVFKITAITLGVVALVVATLALIWVLLALLWVLLVKVVLPILGCCFGLLFLGFILKMVE